MTVLVAIARRAGMFAAAAAYDAGLDTPVFKEKAVNPTLEQWTALGLDPKEHALWLVMSSATKRRTRAALSVVRAERWIVYFPVPQPISTHVILAKELQQQRAHDIAAFLRGELEFSVLCPTVSPFHSEGGGVE